MFQAIAAANATYELMTKESHLHTPLSDVAYC